MTAATLTRPDAPPAAKGQPMPDRYRDSGPASTPEAGTVTLVPPEPWWKDLHGLDPARPVRDVRLAARFAVIHCVIRVFGEGVMTGENIGYLVKTKAPFVICMRAWYRWLAAAEDEADAVVRRVTLRELCDVVGDPRAILPTALALCGAIPHDLGDPADHAETR